jgi:hypothetical protein
MAPKFKGAIANSAAFSLNGPIVAGDRELLATLLNASKLDEFSSACQFRDSYADPQ